MLKRGLSHIEFVLSFIIFIAFILFAFIFFNPFHSGRTLKSTLDYSWLEVTQKTNDEIETYSVSIDPTMTNSIAIEIPDTNGYNATVEDIDGSVIDAYLKNGAVYFEKPQDGFVKIKYSKVFPNGLTRTGTILDDDNYYISSSKSEELYFEKLFLELNDTYFSNYSSLKKDFNLPNRVEFGFVVKFKDNFEIISLNEIPEGYEVLSKGDRVEIIRNSGKREYADIRVLVW